MPGTAQAVTGGGETAQGGGEQAVAVFVAQAVKELTDQPGDVVGEEARHDALP